MRILTKLGYKNFAFLISMISVTASRSEIRRNTFLINTSLKMGHLYIMAKEKKVWRQRVMRGRFIFFRLQLMLRRADDLIIWKAVTVAREARFQEHRMRFLSITCCVVEDVDRSMNTMKRFHALFYERQQICVKANSKENQFKCLFSADNVISIQAIITMREI